MPFYSWAQFEILEFVDGSNPLILTVPDLLEGPGVPGGSGGPMMMEWRRGGGRTSGNVGLEAEAELVGAASRNATSSSTIHNSLVISLMDIHTTREDTHA